MDFDKLAVDNFRQYLRIKTVQPSPDYAACTVFLEMMATDVGLAFETYECVAGKPIVIMTWRGADPSLPSLLLNSHTDVVPVSEAKWSVDPFSAHMDADGRIFARGAQDMKCVGIGYLEAVRRLKSTGFVPKRTVILTFVPDEEIGGHDGMELFVSTGRFRELNVGVALDEGFPSPTASLFVINQERAPWWVKIKATGVTGHGSTLPQGTAMDKLFGLMKKAYAFRDTQVAKLAEEKGRLGQVTSVNITKFQCGVQTNVIPDSAELSIDVRISPTLGTQGFQEILDSWTSDDGLAVEFEQKTALVPASSTDSADPFWRCISTCLADFGFAYTIETFPGATDSRFLRELGIPAYGLSPFNLTPPRPHDHDEFLQKDIFLQGVRFYEQLISGLGSTA